MPLLFLCILFLPNTWVQIKGKRTSVYRKYNEGGKCVLGIQGGMFKWDTEMGMEIEHPKWTVTIGN